MGGLGSLALGHVAVCFMISSHGTLYCSISSSVIFVCLLDTDMDLEATDIFIYMNIFEKFQ